MSRRSVTHFLAIYLCVVWGAFLVRCDRFPLTWAPMYSLFQPLEVLSSRVVDHGDYARGVRVTRRDGSTGYVGRRELNVPRSHMYRIYYQRTFGQPAIKHAHANENLSKANRWLRGLEPDELALPNDTEFQIFRSLNQTLGYAPDDPEFIVRVQAEVERVNRRIDDLSESWRTLTQADIRWNEAWRERW